MLLDVWDELSIVWEKVRPLFQVLGDPYGAGNSDLDRNLQLDRHWAYDGTDDCWPARLHKVEELDSW